MLKLTDEQMGQLRRIQEDTVGTKREQVEAVFSALFAMVNASPTHRVVGAPEGYEFDPSIANMLAKRLDYPFIQVAIKPIPKPCPSPVLEPVTVTVEQRYPAGYEIPEGWLGKFGQNGELQKQGFTHYISISEDFVSTTVCEMRDGNWNCDTATIIGLRKWEPK